MARTKRTSNKSTGGTEPSRAFLATKEAEKGSAAVGGIKYFDRELERVINKNEEDVKKLKKWRKKLYRLCTKDCRIYCLEAKVQNELLGLANAATQRCVVQKAEQKALRAKLEAETKRADEMAERCAVQEAEQKALRAKLEAETKRADEMAEWCAVLEAGTIPIKTNKSKNMPKSTEYRLLQVLLKRQKTS